MKKLLFVIPEYSHGGTNKSLENLLSLIDKEKYEISIYCLYEDGGDYYKRLFAPYILKKSRLYYWLHDNVLTRKLIGLWNKVTRRDNFGWLYNHETRYLQGKYGFDVVVAYQEGTATEFVSYFMEDVEKIAWIHFDYSMLKNKVDLRSSKRYYDKYYRIVCVSEAAMRSMLSVYPEYNDKAIYIYNTLNASPVQKQAENDIDEIPCDDTFNILSIGRFVDIKNFHHIPEIVSKVREIAHRPFCWYLMGDGKFLEIIRNNINEYAVAKEVKIISPRGNPYPFFKQASLHVCLSEFESFSYTIAEAKVLHTPVLCNDFPVAYEVVDKHCGWIANIKDMPEVLARIIDNVDGEYDRKKEAAMAFEYSNEQILEKIDELFEN